MRMTHKIHYTCPMIVLTLLAFLMVPVGAAEEEALTEEEKQAQIGDAMANPLSNLWMMFAQNDTIWYDGALLDTLNKDARVQNTSLIMPVMPMQLTEEWKAIFRPVIPINSFDTVGGVDISTNTTPSVTGVNFDREFGLGDIVLWNAFSNHYTPPFVYGFGPTVMLPTATDDQLGTGKWSAGPMALAMSITDKWIIGGVAQHWWSFSGDDSININTNLGPQSVERPDVSLTDVQYIIRRTSRPLRTSAVLPTSAIIGKRINSVYPSVSALTRLSIGVLCR